MAEQYLERDIKFLRRGGYKRTVIFWENDKVTRKDTTGYTLFLELSKNNKVIETLSIASGHIQHTPAQGQFNISLTDTEVLAFDFTSAEYRMWVDYGDDYPQVLEKGTVRIE